MPSPTQSVLAALAVTALCACHEQNQAAQAPPPPQAVETVTTTAANPCPTYAAPKPQPPQATSQTSTTSGEVNASAELMKECQANFNAEDKAPKFDTAKSDLKGDDQAILQMIATCVTTGPLKGRELTVVGHTDPRGSIEYNQKLGEARATSVSQYLTDQLGVPKSSITTSSRGELDAIGTDEATWSLDRRVDIDLK
jgi:peptidoglycan-associated lipoprotein